MRIMDDIRYMCYCKSIFSSPNAFHSHKSCCEHFQNSLCKSAKTDKTLMTVPGTQIIQYNAETRADVTFKVVKSWTSFLGDENEEQRPEIIATNLWGRRLPRRTKVPYLSRAVSLSTDHSYERCPCGAVFVTRLGKRQHQARFCKFVKNKNKKSPSTETVNESTQTASFCNIKTNSIEHDNFIITEEINNFEGMHKSYRLHLQEAEFTLG